MADYSSTGAVTQVVTESVGSLAVNHRHSVKFLLAMFLVTYVMWMISIYVLKGAPTGNKYLAISGIIVAVLVGVTIFTSLVDGGQIFTVLSFALFVWYAWDTYKTYKDSGQAGIANIQVLMMISIVATVVVTKFVLADDGGLPEMISVFFTIVSFCLLYLIHNLEAQACDTPAETNMKELIYHGIFFIVVFSLTGRHPLIALAISVAAFAYFSYAAKKISDGVGANQGGEVDNDGQGDGVEFRNGGGIENQPPTTEKYNMLITTFLIIISAFKMMFPRFSIAGVINSKPVQIMINVMTICAIVSFIVINILYSMKFNTKTITAYMFVINVLIAVITLFKGFFG